MYLSHGQREVYAGRAPASARAARPKPLAAEAYSTLYDSLLQPSDGRIWILHGEHLHRAVRAFTKTAEAPKRCATAGPLRLVFCFRGIGWLDGFPWFSHRRHVSFVDYLLVPSTACVASARRNGPCFRASSSAPPSHLHHHLLHSEGCSNYDSLPALSDPQARGRSLSDATLESRLGGVSLSIRPRTTRLLFLRGT